MTRRSDEEKTSERARAHAAMLEEALKRPGIPEIMRVYGDWRDPNALMQLFFQAMQREWANDACRQFRVPEPRRLADALAELAEVDDEIAEENLPQVGETTKAEAERLVRALTRHAPARVLLAVYPTQDAEIALHFKSPDRPNAVVVLLNDSGQADCHAYIDGRGRRSHYETSADLPDAFLLDQLCRLTPPIRNSASTPNAGFFLFPQTNLPPMW